MPCQNCLENGMNPFCAGLSGSVRGKLCELGRPIQSIEPFERVYWSGERRILGRSNYCMRDLLLIQSGLGVWYVDTEAGIPVCYGFAGAGALLGDWYLFGNHAHPFSENSYFEVVQTLRGCLIPRDRLERMFLECPELARTVQEHIARDVADMVTHMSKMATYDSVQKVRYLWRIFSAHGINLNELTHETIAHILNLNRVTVTKALKTVLLEGWDNR